MEEVEFGKRETWTISEFAHDIATDAMLLVFLHELEDYLDADFSAVHAANMAKLWTEDEVESRFIDAKIVIDHASRIDFVTPEGTWTATPSSNVDNGLWIVHLNGKVQKPPGWKAAVLEGGAV